MNKKTGKKLIRTITILLLFSVFLIGGVYSWMRQSAEVTNEMNSHTTRVSIEEPETEFEVKSNFTQDKHVAFRNEGDSAVFLRVAYTETWEKGDENEEKLMLPDQTGGQDVAVKNWTSQGLYEEDYWFDGGDGWFYYKRVLQPGQSTEQILESVTFPEFTGAYKEYEDADYHLFFQVEAVQASVSKGTLNAAEVNADATWSTFGMTAELGADRSQVIWSREAPGNR